MKRVTQRELKKTERERDTKATPQGANINENRDVITVKPYTTTPKPYTSTTVNPYCVHCLSTLIMLIMTEGKGGTTPTQAAYKGMQHHNKDAVLDLLPVNHRRSSQSLFEDAKV